MDGLGLKSWNSSGVSVSEILNWEFMLKIACVELLKSMRGEVVVNVGKG